MKKGVMILGISLIMTISSGISAFAEEPVITPIRTINNAYYFETDEYNAEENIMPFYYSEQQTLYKGCGYADGNFNIVIPLQEDWRYAHEFVEGIAVVEVKESYIAVDKSGNKLFDMEPANYYTGAINRFKNDPNGYVACVIRNNGSLQFNPHNLTMTTYDRAGNRTEYPLSYDKIGKFIDGYANVYKVDETWESNISFNGGSSSTDTHYSYKAVGSVNSKGEFFNKTNKDEEKTYSLRKTWKLSNGYSLVYKEGEDWGGNYVLVDSNGTEYGKYLDVQGVMNGNQFIGRPYKTREEVTQYINQHGENPNGLTGYQFFGGEYTCCDLTPRTIFEVNN